MTTAVSTQTNPQKPMTPGGALAAFVPQDSAQLLKLADVLSKSGDMVPKQFQGNAPAITAAIMRGMEVGLNPMQALSSIAVINGRATLWGDALPALVQRAGHHIDVEYEGQGDGLTAVATLTRADGKKVVRRFSIADAKRAQLFGKPGPWQAYPQRMIAHRARAWAIRDGAADALMGMQVAEEVNDYGPDHAREVNPQSAPAPRRGGVVYADAEIVDEVHEGEVIDPATLSAPTDEEIQRQIAEDHARELARLDEQP
jgi:hypothetical protein